MPSFPVVVREKYEHKEGSQEGGELVGGDKTGKKQALQVLQRVFVPDSGIDGPGDDGEIAKVCGGIKELDLGGNTTLAGWAPVQAITSQLPKLSWLGLDRLPLPQLDTLPEGFGAAFGGLTTLCVSGTGMQWAQLLFLASATPKLIELHFSANELTSLTTDGAADPASVLPNLKELYLENNKLASWEAIAPLGALPALTLLNLNHNLLSAVPTPADGTFASLRHLMLRSNPIEAWASVDALNAFPNLTEARLAEMPLTSSTSGAVARRTIIARLGKLKALNGSEVRPRERDDAERFYLRAVAQEYPEGGLPEGAVVDADAPTDITDAPPPPPAKVDEYGRPIDAGELPPESAGGGRMILRLPENEEWTALQTKHPRWAGLLLKHGTHVTRTSGTAQSGGVIANELIEVTMRAVSAESAHLPAAVRRLPGGLPLKSIKLIACQLFKVEPSKMQLFYTPPGQDRDIPEELDDDTSTLADLGVLSGGTIVIDDNK